MSLSPENNFERLKASLVSLVSHELRTPLTYISASLEMLEIAHENPEMQDQTPKFLSIIDQGVQQLNTMIDELLTFSELESNPQQHSGRRIARETDVKELVLSVVNILKGTYQARQQVFEISIQEELPTVEVDPSKLSEIVLQLLSNAIKFTPEKGHVRILVMEQNEMLHLLISDTGPGIPEDVQAQIFDPFYQKEHYLIREKGGLGLGLTVVQRLCNALGARLEMSTEVTGYSGTNFSVWLPLKKDEEPREDFQAILDQMQDANAQKDQELTRLKSQLLTYTRDLYQAYRTNEKKQSELDSIYVDVMGGFAAAMQVRDPFMRGRAQRMATYAEAFAEGLGFDAHKAQILEQACLLCDIGYLGISDEVLQKAETQKLSEGERAHIQTHPQIAANMLLEIKAFAPVVPVILHHHENWDGSGYPGGLSQEEIPYLSRVVRIVDAFDAMLSDRAYRRRFEPEYAVKEIQRHAGSQFDPELVKLFTELWEAEKIRVVPSANSEDINALSDTGE